MRAREDAVEVPISAPVNGGSPFSQIYFVAVASDVLSSLALIYDEGGRATYRCSFYCDPYNMMTVKVRDGVSFLCVLYLSPINFREQHDPGLILTFFRSWVGVVGLCASFVDNLLEEVEGRGCAR